ncbi:MAG: ABC transporter ATP-binding protein [Anaerolineae bacterium]|nr:ABC transporter ATP-binding protein [Anaerolineae bacterium]
MSNIVLQVSNLHKSYGAFHAVQGLSFSLQKGEIFGLLGPNGAGKTTTISMITGLVQPDSGSIQIEGINLAQQSNQAKMKLGLVPQELALYPTLSARDNLIFFGQIYGLHGRRLKQQVERALQMVSLSERANEAVNHFSGGMKRRVNIAAGLLHEPDILFLDEPTVGVDPQSRNAIFESIEALNQAGMTIIYTTHYMEEAQRLCRRVAIVDHGQIIALDTPQNLIHAIGQGVIRVGLNNGHAERLVQSAQQLPCIRSIALHDGYLDVQANDSQSALMNILSISQQIGAKLTSLQILEANLETVFLSLTGKTLRE